jgi:hypothetical protein
MPEITQLFTPDQRLWRAACARKQITALLCGIFGIFLSQTQLSVNQSGRWTPLKNLRRSNKSFVVNAIDCDRLTTIPSVV